MLELIALHHQVLTVEEFITFKLHNNHARLRLFPILHVTKLVLIEYLAHTHLAGN